MQLQPFNHIKTGAFFKHTPLGKKAVTYQKLSDTTARRTSQASQPESFNSSDEVELLVGGPHTSIVFRCQVWVNDIGEFSRTDGPAQIYTSGKQCWYLNNQLHRPDGPAIINPPSSRGVQEEWYLHGLRHRDNGPAEIWADGSKYWWFNNQRHCASGPAIVAAVGDTRWYLHGTNYTLEEFQSVAPKLV